MGKLNKVAVVSGAARGQGRSHAVNLAAEGAIIIDSRYITGTQLHVDAAGT